MDWNILIDAFLKKNSELNLSAIRDEEWVRIKHINDSLKIHDAILLDILESFAKEWIDFAYPTQTLYTKK